MSNIFPIKELEERKQYLLGIDCYDSTSQALIVYDLDTGYVVESRGFCNEDKFNEEVKRIAEYYNAIGIKDLPQKAIESSQRRYGINPEAHKNYIQSQSFKDAMLEYFKDWLEKEDVINNVRVIR